jgi:hypothetical protein
VASCVAVQVYVCDGDAVMGDAGSGAGSAPAELAALRLWPGGVTILTDPDAAGRELRLFLDGRLQPQGAGAQAKQGRPDRAAGAPPRGAAEAAGGVAEGPRRSGVPDRGWDRSSGGGDRGGAGSCLGALAGPGEGSEAEMSGLGERGQQVVGAARGLGGSSTPTHAAQARHSPPVLHAFLSVDAATALADTK